MSLTTATQDVNANPTSLEPGPDRLMPVEETAKMVTLSADTLNKWRSTKEQNLPFVKVGRYVRYRRSAVLRWLESRSS